MIFIRLFTADWLAAHAHMSLLQRGALMSLTVWYWSHEQPLPPEHEAVHRIVGALLPDEQRAVADVLQSHFTLTPDGWRSVKLDADIQEARDAMQAAQESGRRGASKRWGGERHADPNGVGNRPPNGVPIGEGNGDTYAYSQSQSQSQSQSEKETPPVVPQGDGLEVEFARFWKRYPRKDNKKAALKAWLKLSPTPALIEVILAAVQRHAAGQQWQRNGGQFIPYASSWLNGGRWEDAVVEAAPTAFGQMFSATQATPTAEAEVIDA